MKLALAVIVLAGCLSPSPYVQATSAATRKAHLRAGGYQEALSVAATYKSPEWRLAYAQKDIEARGLTGASRDARIAQAQAEASGPFEVELLVTTWDRRENDLERGDKSAWHVRLLDDAGTEVKPLEVVKDKRPHLVVRAEFPAMGDFATAYVARFPRKVEGATAEPTQIRVRLSSERGGVEVTWPAK